MGAGVKQNYVVLLGVLEEGNQLVDLDLLGLWVVVGVLLDLKVGPLDYVLVIGPGRRGNQDLDLVAVELLPDEFEAQTKGTSP